MSAGAIRGGDEKGGSRQYSVSKLCTAAVSVLCNPTYNDSTLLNDAERILIKDV